MEMVPLHGNATLDGVRGAVSREEMTVRLRFFQRLAAMILDSLISAPQIGPEKHDGVDHYEYHHIWSMRRPVKNSEEAAR